MANKKINDLSLAGSVVDTMQFETDIGGATANKVTALQMKNYITLWERELISGSDYRLNPQESLNDRINTSTAYQIGKVDVLSTPGTANVAIGENSNGSLTTGEQNVFVGYNTGSNTDVGSYNCYLGYEAGKTGTSAQFNTAFGYKTLTAITNASNNTAMGNQCGAAITTGGYNTLIGTSAGVQTTTASSTVGIGREAARINNADYLIAIGHRAGRANLTSTGNIYIGKDSGLVATGANNTFTGYESGDAVTTGGNNTLYGCQTGGALTTETGNVHIGYQAGAQSTESNMLYIDNSSTTNPLIKGDFANSILTFRGVRVETVSSVINIVAANGLTSVTDANMRVQSSTAGDTTVTANPAIVAGSTGQVLTVWGADDTKTVTFTDGNGLKLDNGLSVTLGLDDNISFKYINSNWVETSRIIVS